MTSNVYDEFVWRGVVYDASEGLQEVLATQRLTAYIGFDPSAASLHVGSLLPVMNLARLQRHGHTPIGIVGGGTGMIGDPSGKTQERQLLTPEVIDRNLAGIRRQLENLLDFETARNPARLINNADWLRPLPLIDFLRDIGKYFTVNYMLSKESVKRRLEQEDGVSVTEFFYMLLQSYDFLHLYDHFQCTLQMGGSDQWGNITAGMDLIRRLRGGKAHGLVFPLVTSATGQKFGKTEAGAVWLDPALTSPFKFFQFWLNTHDQDVVTYLKYFTLLDRDAIDVLQAATLRAPEQREAQRKLAQDVTRMIHGETELQKAEQATKALFGGDIAGLTALQADEIFEDVPSRSIPRSSFDGPGMSIVDLAIEAGFAAMKGEARRLIEQGGMYVNNRRISDPKARVTLTDTIEGRSLVLRKGNKSYFLVRATE